MTNKNDKNVSEKMEKEEKNEQHKQKNASHPPLFSQLEAINAVTHQTLYYHPATKDDFARKTHALPLVLQEIMTAALDTPVLFIREGDIWGIIALVGIRAGEGCRVDENGHWQGYRPLYLRFYPFTTGVTETEETLLCLDRGFAGLNEDNGNGGHPLFKEDGTPGSWLLQVNSDMASYTLARKTTGDALELLSKLELLQPATARVVTSSGGVHHFDGFFVVDRDALKALPVEKLSQLRDEDLLEPVYAHLLSLQHLPALMQLAEKTRTTGTTGTNIIG